MYPLLPLTTPTSKHPSNYPSHNDILTLQPENTPHQELFERKAKVFKIIERNVSLLVCYDSEIEGIPSAKNVHLYLIKISSVDFALSL